MQGSDIINPLLPPSFRFHPTDEELIVHYLRNKVSSTIFFASLIADVDLYKFDPWELPDKALFGENEWFFFSPRDRKYPNGARPNRAATSGYWKATGTDKAIISSKGSQCIGVKKALVFYQGRPPKGTKTSWMMYEYRLLNHSTHSTRLKGSMRLDDWVLCRIHHKSDTPIKFNARNDSPSPSYNALDTLQENNMIGKLNYLNDFEMPPKDKEIFDGLGHLDWKEATSLPYFTQGTLEIQTDSPSCPSNTDAFATIKRVLSVGTINEQVLLMSNKRPCSITCSNSDESGIFDQNFTY